MSNALLKVTKRKTLAQVAYEYLKDEIIKGTLADGELITGQQVGAALQMSRTPIKQALTQLEVEGYVRCIDGVGHIVEGLTYTKLKDLYEVRISIELLAFRRSVKRIAVADLWNLKKKLVNELAVYRQNPLGYNISKIADIDEEFHQLFLTHSGNQYAAKIFFSIQEQINRYRYKAYSMTDTTEESILQHIAIIDDFLAASYEEAELKLKKHLEWSATVLCAAIFGPASV